MLRNKMDDEKIQKIILPKFSAESKFQQVFDFYRLPNSLKYMPASVYEICE